ncbi:cytochrome oxidase assembly protein 1 [Knufia obscura]|nr:cytochrome oxidase assembly protein 1 [Knufia obscura]
MAASNTKLIRSLCALPPSLRQTILLPRAQLNPSPSTQLSIFTRQPLRHATTKARVPEKIEPLIPPPTPTSGPLLERLPNRALPALSRGLTPATKTWLRTLPLFILLCALGSFSIFNYQKSSSSTVSSILYALRTSPTVRELLGDEIYFNSKIPWISGELNQLHGHIDISFWVKGTKGVGLVRFVSVRRRRDGYFETLEWSLTMEDGRVLQLLGAEGARDPNAGAGAGGQRIVVGEDELL